MTQRIAPLAIYARIDHGATDDPRTALHRRPPDVRLQPLRLLDGARHYGELLAEAGSSAFMLYGNASDAMSVAYQTVRKPRPEDFGLTADDLAPATPAPPIAPVDPTDLPF